MGTLHRKHNLEVTLRFILNDKRNTYFLSLKKHCQLLYLGKDYFNNTFFRLNGFDTTDTVIVQWTLHVEPPLIGDHKSKIPRAFFPVRALKLQPLLSDSRT